MEQFVELPAPTNHALWCRLGAGGTSNDDDDEAGAANQDKRSALAGGQRLALFFNCVKASALSVLLLSALRFALLAS